MLGKRERTLEEAQATRRRILVTISVALGIVAAAGVLLFGGFSVMVTDLSRLRDAFNPNIVLAEGLVLFMTLAIGVAVAQIAYDTLIQHFDRKPDA